MTHRVEGKYPLTSVAVGRAQMVQALVHRDPVYPRRQCRLAIECPHRPVDGYENLLRQVLRGMNVLYHTYGSIVHPLPVFGHQFGIG